MSNAVYLQYMSIITVKLGIFLCNAFYLQYMSRITVNKNIMINYIYKIQCLELWFIKVKG